MSCNFSLKWNSHYIALLKFFSSLHEKHRFSDATIACEGKLYPVHRFVLAACSDYFNAIFDGFAGDCIGPQHHPVLILRDISSTTLEDLLRYMYLGEVTVEQGIVSKLLKAAGALQVKGLSVMDDDSTPLNNHEIATKSSTSDCTADASSLAKAGSGSNQDLCDAPISSESDLNQLSIPEEIERCHPLLTQNQCHEEEGPPKKPRVVRNRRAEPVGQHVPRLNNMHNGCDPGITPPAVKKHGSHQPATNAIDPRHAITRGSCSSLCDPAFTIKLEPGVETLQTLVCGVVAPPHGKPAGVVNFSTPMDSTSSSPQLPMDSNPRATPHSPESSYINSCSDAHCEELSTCSSSVNCIPLVQLQTEATNDESTYLVNGEPSSSGSHTSMPVITDCYSLLQSETTYVHKVGHLGAAWMSQPRMTPTAPPFFPFNSSKNSLMESSSLEENEVRSGIYPPELAGSNFNENVNVNPSKIENDSEFQALKWTIPPSMTYQIGRRDHTNQDKNATENCATDKRRRVFRCSRCSYLTRRKRLFLRHQLHLCPHRPRVQQKWRSVVSKHFDCKHCEYSASNSSNLKKHLLRHSQKKLFQCLLCSYSTDKDYFLQAHMTKDHGSQSRSGKNLILISDCSEKVSVDGIEDAQPNISLTDGNYMCEHCHYCFQKKNCLLEHERIHTKPDNVKCPDCDYRMFRNFFNMKKHTSLPSRGSFKCDFCSYTACTEHLLAKHAKLDQLKLTHRKPLKTEPVPALCSCKEADGTDVEAMDNADDYCCC